MLKYLNNKLIVLEDKYISKNDILVKLIDLIDKNTNLLLEKELFLE